MKRLLFVFTLMLSPVPTLAPPRSQTGSDIEFTSTFTNGRFWLAASRERKLGWIYGYDDAVKLAAIHVRLAEPANNGLFQSLLDLEPTQKLTLGEIMLAMDHFYQDTPENAPVPVEAVMQYVERKANGATPSELNEIAAGLRKAAMPEKQP